MDGMLQIKVGTNNRKNKRKNKEQSCESDQFQLQYHQIKKLGLPVNKKKLRIGNWTPEENRTYLNFLEKNKSDFVTQQQRRKKKVFYRLSKILKKRTPDQCRSHHQKLQMKYEDDIDKIIENIRKKLLRKCPELLLGDDKQNDISKKKTEQIDEIKGNEQQQMNTHESMFYKFMKDGQNQFRLIIQLDRMEIWP